ncbi:META domain-containing protein [Hymenobacter aerophilus]|uniref:META domain-containing protein n=1 Tax=Hymenobacter aerophilus TaxID=119644 RepID=UPI000366A455|nr:META domain-containing protein [Hymenobacter aerophilus]
MKKYLLTLLLAPALLTGCESTKNTPTTTPDTTTGMSQQTDGILNKHWQLVELEGQPVKLVAGQERDAYFMLTDSTRVVGFGGCNSLNGSYELNQEQMRLRFTNVLTTLRACPGTDYERGFLDVLNQTDNYTMRGDMLMLNVGRRAPLAVFRAVK